MKKEGKDSEGEQSVERWKGIVGEGRRQCREETKSE